MKHRLADHVAVITGGGNGIGREIAERFAEVGASVVVADKDTEGGRGAVRNIEEGGGTAVFVETDVTDFDAVEALVEASVEEFGSLDILISNAGGSAGDDTLHRLSVKKWEQMIDLNLTSHFYCARAALPYLIQDGGGSIVFMSSVNGLIGIGLTSYSAAKSGLLGFSRVLASHYGRHGVRSNVLCPGTIQSESLTKKRENRWTDEQLERWEDQYPLGRFGRPDEVADAALFLASDQSSFMTGQEVVLDGGLTAGLNQSLLDVMYDIDKISL